ncbi:MAG: NADPH:quinone oxidoreductase family protein [Gemmatimonadota bacterium]
MKALVASTYGPPEQLTLIDLPSPVPGAGQVLIDVHACGVNFPDALIIEGKYQIKPPFPFAPGCEVAGTVGRLGPDTSGVTVGDRVAAVIGHGGFAEQIVADRSALVPLGPGVSDEVGSALLLAHGTSLYALADRAELAAGETLLVLGAAGGVGLAAVEIGKALGARVIAAASGEEKLQVCREHGADETIDYKAEDLRERIKALTSGKGVDVAYDPVGGALAEPAVRSLAWGGRYLVVGFASGEIPRIPLNLLLLKGAALVGVYWGEFAKREPERYARNVRRLFELLESGTIRPRIAASFPLRRGGEAIRFMLDRRVIGKVVVTMGAAS